MKRTPRHRRGQNSAPQGGQRSSGLEQPAEPPRSRLPWVWAYIGAAGSAVLPFTLALPTLTTRFLGSDQTDLNLQFRHFIGFAVRWLHQGVIPSWNPHTFCGTPFLPNTAATIFSPTCAPFLLTLPQPLSINLVILAHCALLATGTVWWARGRGVSSAGALMAGLLASLSAAMTCRVFAGHYTIVTTLAWFPWVLGFHDRHLTGARSHPAFFGGVCALMFFGGHAQYVYYASLLLALNLFLAGVSGKRWQTPGWLRAQARFHLTAGLVALLLAGIELIPLADTLRYSARAGARGAEWLRFFSMPPENYLSLLAPRFLGSGTDYWGRWYWWETTVYMGWVGMALVVAATASPRASRSGPLLILLMAIIVLACAGFIPGLREAVGLVPGWGLFRGHAKILGPGMVIAAVVGAHGFDALRSARSGRPRTAALWTVAIMGFTCVLLLAAGAHLLPALFLRPDDRMALADSPENPIGPMAWRAWRHAFAVAAGWAVLASVWLALRPRLSVAAWSGVGLVLALADGLFFSMPSASSTFVPERDKPLAEVANYLRRHDPFVRIEVPGVLLAADPLTAGFDALGGHDFNVTKYFSTFAAAMLREPPGEPYLNFMADRESPLLDAANVGYWVPPGPAEAAALTGAGLVTVASAGGLEIIKRPRALPRAYVTGTVRFVPDTEQAVWQALSEPPDFHAGAVLTGDRPADMREEAFPPVAAKVEYSGLHAVEVTAPRDGWLVLTDGYSPRWQASIRGEHVPIYRANGLFRAVQVHRNDKVRFMLDRSPLAVGAAMTALGLICLVAAAFGRFGKSNPGSDTKKPAVDATGAECTLATYKT
ncbi:MAG: hypothetical protein N2111_00200 [Candidatus Sumerlaeaceae bacterium]|nr:hypothetical protein [Candidatus Sumerlaeaceae bacterium]